MNYTNRKKSISDKQADQSITSLNSYSIVPALEFFHDDDNVIIDEQCKQEHDSQISTAELKLLKAIVINPMQPSSVYAGLARISPNTFQKLRKTLIQRGYIREHKLESGGRGRSKILLEPLESAKKITGKNNEFNGDRSNER